MDSDELGLICANVEICRNKVDGMQMRDYMKRQNTELTRAMLAASWSLRVAHYCLQRALITLESHIPATNSPGSTDPQGGD